jgi:hypothetical protein
VACYENLVRAGTRLNNTHIPILDLAGYTEISDVNVPRSLSTGLLTVLLQLDGTGVIL